MGKKALNSHSRFAAGGSGAGMGNGTLSAGSGGTEGFSYETSNKMKKNGPSPDFPFLPSAAVTCHKS